MRPGWAHVEMCGRRGRHWLHGLDGLHLVLHGIRGSLRLGVLCLAWGWRGGRRNGSHVWIMGTGREVRLGSGLLCTCTLGRASCAHASW